MSPQAPIVRGVELSTVSTLGWSDASQLGTSAGNGFRTRWADDLALLSDHDAGAVRLTLDWARLQPKPGELDHGWTEFYDAVLDAAEAIELPVWLCLHERAVPKWFDNEGGFDDDTAAGRWWPRFAEAVADHFGDHAAGWLPFATSPVNRSAVWAPTWSALRGGPPVAATFALPEARQALRGDDEALDALALHLRLGDLDDVDGATSADRRGTDDHGGALDASIERFGELVRMASDEGPARPIGIGWLELDTSSAELHARLLSRARTALDEAVADGVEVVWAFASPGIGTDAAPALFTRDREPTASASGWLDDDAG